MVDPVHVGQDGDPRGAEDDSYNLGTAVTDK